jgi:hypothetical protein
MRSGLFTLIFLFSLSACRPADVKVESVKNRVLAGKTVTFDEPGFSLCGTGAPWTDMRLGGDDERQRIVLGQQSSFIYPGFSTCYRVGDTVALTLYKNPNLKGGGFVRVDRISLVLLDNLKGSQLRGQFFATDTSFNGYMTDLRKRMNPSMMNVITFVDLTYIPGSAVDEAKIRATPPPPPLPAYSEVTEAGKFLDGTNCTKPYAYIPAPADLQPQFTDGSIQSWYEFGTSVCFTPGQTLDLSPGKGSASLGKVTVTKVKRFAVSDLKADYFVLGNKYDFQNIVTRVQSARKPGNDWMVVIDFTLGGAQ